MDYFTQTTLGPNLAALLQGQQPVEQVYSPLDPRAQPLARPQVTMSPSAAAWSAQSTLPDQELASAPSYPTLPELPAQLNIQDLIAAAERNYQPLPQPELTARDRADLLLRMGLSMMAAGGEGKDPLTALAGAGTSTLNQRDQLLLQKRQQAEQQRAMQQAAIDRGVGYGLQQGQLDMGRYGAQVNRADAGYTRDYTRYRDQVGDRNAAASRALQQAELDLRRNLGYANLQVQNRGVDVQERGADLKEMMGMLKFDSDGTPLAPALKPGEYLTAKTKVFEALRNDPTTSRLTPAQFAQLYRETLARNFGTPVGKSPDGRIVVSMPAGEPDVTLDQY